MNAFSKLFITAILLSALFVNDALSTNTQSDNQSKPIIENVFDSKQWQIKQGKDYPHRDKMLNGILYTDKFRKLNKDELLIELGEPSYYRDDKNYLHYIITQTRLLSWPLHTKVLVIKLKDDETVEWIKLHK